VSNPLKAYSVTEDGEGYGAVVFATNGATARREGASELNTEWECIQSCVRAPEFDQYAPGPVPPMTLIEHDWWFECSHCGTQVSKNMGFDPRPHGKRGVFCGESCECAHHMQQRGREEAADALREVFVAKFPGAQITDIHICDGPKLVAPEDTTRGRGRYVVTFTFPGSQYASQWDFGSETCLVPQIDVDAYKAWKSTQEAE
jgi:hypothetical protein